MNKKNQGFTLVELLVTVAILGLITAMSFPVLRRIQENNKMNKLEIYKNSLEELSKTYVEAYESDLFDENPIKCAVIDVNMLKQKKIFKDIEMDSISCDSNNTFIKVTYSEDSSRSRTGNRSYKYSVYLGCGNKVDGNVNDVNIVLPQRDVPYTIDEICS